MNKILKPYAGGLGYRASQWAAVAVQATAGTAVQLAEAVSSRPVVPAVALVGFALGAPSAAAAGA